MEPTKVNKTNKFLSLIKRPTSICIGYLGVMFAYAAINRILSDAEQIFPTIFIFSTTILFIYFIPWILGERKVKMINKVDSIISALIFLLIVDPSQSIIVTLIMLTAYLLGRLFIRYKGMPVFNPVVFAVAVLAILSYFADLKPFVSWWAVSFEPRFTDANISIAVLATLPFGIYFALKFKKLYMVTIAFLCSTVFYLVNYFALDKTFDTLFSSYSYTFLEGTFLFAIFLMLAEPKTSPVDWKKQMIAGFIFAVAWTIFTYGKISSGLIFAILSVNVFNFLTKLHFSKKTPVVTVTAPKTV